MESKEYQTLLAQLKQKNINITHVFNVIKLHCKTPNPTSQSELVSLCRNALQQSPAESLLEVCKDEMIMVFENWLTFRHTRRTSWTLIERIGESIKYYNSLSGPVRIYDRFLEFYDAVKQSFQGRGKVELLTAGIAPEWKDADRCMNCKTKFGLLKRKHHCRNCGDVVCDDCSLQRLEVNYFGYQGAVRVCDYCVERIPRAMEEFNKKREAVLSKDECHEPDVEGMYLPDDFRMVTSQEYAVIEYPEGINAPTVSQDGVLRYTMEFMLSFQSVVLYKPRAMLPPTQIYRKEIPSRVKQPKPEPKKMSETVLFLGGLPITATKESIAQFFGVDIVVASQVTYEYGRFRGYGFVEFVSAEECTKVLKKNKVVEMDGWTVELRRATANITLQRHGNFYSPMFLEEIATPEDVHELIEYCPNVGRISNLPDDVTKATLAGLLCPHHAFRADVLLMNGVRYGIVFFIGDNALRYTDGILLNDQKYEMEHCFGFLVSENPTMIKNRLASHREFMLLAQKTIVVCNLPIYVTEENLVNLLTFDDRKTIRRVEIVRDDSPDGTFAFVEMKSGKMLYELRMMTRSRDFVLDNYTLYFKPAYVVIKLKALEDCVQEESKADISHNPNALESPIDLEGDKLSSVETPNDLQSPVGLEGGNVPSVQSSDLSHTPKALQSPVVWEEGDNVPSVQGSSEPTDRTSHGKEEELHNEVDCEIPTGQPCLLDPSIFAKAIDISQPMKSVDQEFDHTSEYDLSPLRDIYNSYRYLNLETGMVTDAVNFSQVSNIDHHYHSAQAAEAENCIVTEPVVVHSASEVTEVGFYESLVMGNVSADVSIPSKAQEVMDKYCDHTNTEAATSKPLASEIFEKGFYSKTLLSISNLPASVSEKTIRDFLGNDKIIGVKLIHDSEKKTSVLVEFKSRKSRDKIHGFVLDGHKTEFGYVGSDVVLSDTNRVSDNVNSLKDATDSNPPQFADHPQYEGTAKNDNSLGQQKIPLSKTVLLVSNLPSSISNQTIYDFFGWDKILAIQRADTDNFSVLVEFKSRTSCDKALRQFQGADLHGRKVTISRVPANVVLQETKSEGNANHVFDEIQTEESIEPDELDKDMTSKKVNWSRTALLVSNLPISVSELSIYELFGKEKILSVEFNYTCLDAELEVSAKLVFRTRNSCATARKRFQGAFIGGKAIKISRIVNEKNESDSVSSVVHSEDCAQSSRAPSVRNNLDTPAILTTKSPSKTKLLVSNLPVTADDSIYTFIGKDKEKVATIERNFAYTNGELRGTALIEFSSRRACDRSFKALQNVVLEGQKVQVCYAESDVDVNNDVRQPSARIDIPNDPAKTKKYDPAFLFVGNLPTSAIRGMLMNHFRGASNAKVVFKDGLFQGYAYVKFKSMTKCQNALKELQASTFHGYLLELHVVGEPIDFDGIIHVDSNPSSRPPRALSKNILVFKKLPESTTEASLRKLLKKEGNVRKVLLKYLNETFLGYAYVEYSSFKNAQKAFNAFKEVTFEGAQLKVNFAYSYVKI